MLYVVPTPIAFEDVTIKLENIENKLITFENSNKQKFSKQV